MLTGRGPAGEDQPAWHLLEKQDSNQRLPADSSLVQVTEEAEE